MAKNINRVLLTGNLTRDPDTRETKSGTTVCNFRMAVNSDIKIDEEWESKANYVSIAAFGRQGENVMQYCKKGAPVAIDGRLDWREWTDSNDIKREGLTVIADSVQFLGGGSRDTSAEPPPVTGGSSEEYGGGPPTDTPPEDDIPF